VHLQSGEGPCRNARLNFTNTARRDIDVHWTSSSGYLIEYQGRQIRFETVLFYVLQTLVDKGQARPLLDENVILLGRPSWRPTEFPLHVLFMSQLITVQVLVILITEAGPMALLQRDNAGKIPFYFLKHRGDGRRANELPARTEQTIADLIVEPFSLPAGELDRSRARRSFSHALRHSTTPLTHGAMSRDGLFRRAADLAS
jgi:hypothetical protein